MKETLKETARLAVDRTVENAELVEKFVNLEDEVLKLKGEKKKTKIKPEIPMISILTQKKVGRKLRKFQILKQIQQELLTLKRRSS